MFTIKPTAGGATVEWAMGGMDKAVGPDFEKGLAQMKALAEKR